MKSKIGKIIIISLLITTLTLAKFIFVGLNFISYAVENVSTNHENVEFEAYFENAEGEKSATMEKVLNDEDMYLHLNISVKKEGYFNGEIRLENANFVFETTDNEKINYLKHDSIGFKQINVDSSVDIKVKIKFLRDEYFELDLLDRVSALKLIGTYKDSTQKDISIDSTREMSLKMANQNDNEDVLNNINVITNKILKVGNEEKRVIQFSWDLGIKENNYPINKIKTKLSLPEKGTYEVKAKQNLTNAAAYDLKYDGNDVYFEVLNYSKNDDGKITWKKDAFENVIITCIYDKDVDLQNETITASEQITFFDNKEINNSNEFVFNSEESESVLTVNKYSEEKEIYKGKLYAGIGKEYTTTTKLDINLAGAIQYMKIKEETDEFKMDETNTIYRKQGDIVFNKVIINKAQFEDIFGGMETGKTFGIYDQDKKLVAIATKDSPTDENGNIIIDLQGKNVVKVEIKTSVPIKEGSFEIKYIKEIRDVAEEDIINANFIESLVDVEYNLEGSTEYTEGNKIIKGNKIELKNTQTELDFKINKETVAIDTQNDIEMRAILQTSEERNDLYKNPRLVIVLPEQLESVVINSVDLLYEDELAINNYKVEGRNIIVELEGEQTTYSDLAVDGATVIINASFKFLKEATGRNDVIQMICLNENSKDYQGNNYEVVKEKNIKIVAPMDVTPIYNIDYFKLETVGKEENTRVEVNQSETDTIAKTKVQLINNNTVEIKDVKISGVLPTNNSINNLNVEVGQLINVISASDYQILYTNNENASDDINDINNNWTGNFSNDAKKYIIIIEKIAAQEVFQAEYDIKIPGYIEYNQKAKTFYKAEYTNSESGMKNTVNSTIINIESVVEPVMRSSALGDVSEIETNLKTVRLNNESNIVKNGEVIKYRIETTNKGNSTINNISLTGNIPEGSVMVEPIEKYEYAGEVYYNELPNNEYKETIGTIKAGETIIKDYEVRVLTDTEEGTVLNNKIVTSYSDFTQESNNIENIVDKGEMRITVKRVTDRNIELYALGDIEYFAIIENTSNEVQNNVEIKTNKSNNLEVRSLELYKNIGQSNSSEEILQYSSSINVGDFNPGEVKILKYHVLINKVEETINNVVFAASASESQNNYYSNIVVDEIHNYEIAVDIETNTSSKYVKTGDVIEYIITVENKSNVAIRGLQLLDEIPLDLTIQKITKDNNEIAKPNGNTVGVSYELEPYQKTIIKIDTVVDYSENRNTAKVINNKAVVNMLGIQMAETEIIEHIIEANKETSTGGDENNPGTGSNNNTTQGTRIISGLAWIDENANGIREDTEKKLEKIKVKLLNAETNNFVKDSTGKDLQVVTDKNGNYVLDKVANGKYIVIFEYDTTLYNLTKYKVQGGGDAKISKATINEIQIDGKKQEKASTDIIEIKNTSISNINIGFINASNFDLKLDKTVTKILVQNSKGSVAREYDNVSLAKIEFKPEEINGTNVIIEYNIKVSNVGEVEGYVKKIADYMPKDLKFSSELNKDWYQTGDVLYNTSLANNKIAAGETKTIKLVLTKTLTENNTGLINNMAEIVEDFNVVGIKDSNSTPGNKKQGENDMSFADVILSVTTGGYIYVIIGSIIGIVILTATIIIIKRKRINS